MKDPTTEAVSNVLVCSRRWVQARMLLRRMLDSKSATEGQKRKARLAVVAAGTALEKAVIALELVRPGGPSPVKTPIDWGKVAGAVAQFAGGVEKAVSSSRRVIDVEVIDTDGKTV
jgi:hypothetical protein